MSLNKSEHENHRIPQDAQIAQLVEQRTENPRVAGSIPALGIFLLHFLDFLFPFSYCLLQISEV